jgi:hypothetical protein
MSRIARRRIGLLEDLQGEVGAKRNYYFVCLVYLVYLVDLVGLVCLVEESPTLVQRESLAGILLGVRLREPTKEERRASDIEFQERVQRITSLWFLSGLIL